MSYTATFYNARRRSTLRAADLMLPRILELAPIESMVDVGCGTGDWLKVAREQGIETIRGVDGPWVSPSKLQIDSEHFTSADLSRRMPRLGRFDMALSLEVGEHLPPQRAASFARELCELAPLVVFSAAIPGQGGLHHINEQWPSYWIEHFDKCGYEVFDILRPRLWNEKRIAYWYRQNVLVFASREEPALMDRLKKAAARCDFCGVDLVHPDHYQRALQYPGVGALVRAFPFAFARFFAGIGTKPPGADEVQTRS